METPILMALHRDRPGTHDTLWSFFAFSRQLPLESTVWSVGLGISADRTGMRGGAARRQPGRAPPSEAAGLPLAGARPRAPGCAPTEPQPSLTTKPPELTLGEHSLCARCRNLLAWLWLSRFRIRNRNRAPRLAQGPKAGVWESLSLHLSPPQTEMRGKSGDGKQHLRTGTGRRGTFLASSWPRQKPWFSF